MNDQAPVISTPEAETPGMVAPGQENILQEFIQEQEAASRAEEQQKILGKFNSPEDLAKAYQELERKLGEGSAPTPDNSSPEPAETPTGYTAEQAAQVYGQEAVDLLSEQGIDLADVMWKADNGQDISSHYDTLAEVFKVPRQVVENYVGKAQARPSADPSPGLTDADVSELKDYVGGEEQFNALSQWAAANMNQQELASYNAAVDSGNKEAIRWALTAMQARASGKPAAAEPKLIGGGQPPAVEQFESKQQVLDAMNKRNERGQRLYDVDEAYRAKIARVLANSDVF